MWRKTTACSTDHVTEQCIEVAVLTDGGLLMRSNLRPTEVISVSSDELRAFMAGVRAGDFDDLV